MVTTPTISQSNVHVNSGFFRIGRRAARSSENGLPWSLLVDICRFKSAYGLPLNCGLRGGFGGARGRGMLRLGAGGGGGRVLGSASRASPASLMSLISKAVNRICRPFCCWLVSIYRLIELGRPRRIVQRKCQQCLSDAGSRGRDGELRKPVR